MLSSEDRAEIQARADAATMGPWKLWGMTVVTDRAGTGDYDDSDDIAHSFDPDRGLRTFNAEFIAHAREDIPKLLAELARIEAERDAALAVIERVRVSRSNHPECDVRPDDDPVSCGWKRAVIGTDKALAASPPDALDEHDRQVIAKHTQTIMDATKEATVAALVDAEMRGYQRKLSESGSEQLAAVKREAAAVALEEAAVDICLTLAAEWKRHGNRGIRENAEADASAWLDERATTTRNPRTPGEETT